MSLIFPTHIRALSFSFGVQMPPGILEVFMKCIHIFLIFLVASVTVYGQAAGKVNGTVYYGNDKSVLHDVSVEIAELKQKTSTNNEGVFEFTNVTPGRYTLKVHQEGFGDAVQMVTVEPGATVNLDFRLQLAGIKENVTVTATGIEQSTFEAIATVNTLDSTQILSRAAVGLGDVLDNQSGVSKRSSGPGNSRPVIRGFDGDRVMVSTDGVSVGSLASQSGDHSEPVDTLSVERIEVVKGPATLLYGSNAIGGVVNAVSGHDEGAHPGFRGYFSTIGGTNSRQAAVSGGVEYGIKNWMFWANGGGQRTGDYKAGGDFGIVNNTFTRNATANFGGGHYAKHWYANVNYSHYQNRFGIPLDFRETEPEDRSIPTHRRNIKLNVGFTELDFFITAAKVTVDISRYKHQEIEDRVVGTMFRNNVTSYRAVFDQKKIGDLTGRFGFDGYIRDYSTIGLETLIDGPVGQTAFSVFTLQELKWERIGLQFGARIENNRYRPKYPTLEHRDFTGFSGAVGARFDLWKGGAFVANYSHSYRAPAIEELYNNGAHDGTLTFEIGNQALRPETNDGIDISLRQQSKRIKADANFYYYNLKNYIFLAPTNSIDPDSGFPIAEYLQGNSRFTGVELNLDFTAASFLNFLAGFDYVNAKLTGGSPLPRIAPMRGRIGIDAHYKNFSIRPEFVAVGDQTRVFVNESPTGGYSVFNIGGSYVLPAKHSAHIFSVTANNLTDRLFFNHISFIKDISPEIGRNVKFSYTVRFF